MSFQDRTLKLRHEISLISTDFSVFRIDGNLKKLGGQKKSEIPYFQAPTILTYKV